jgi:hypothetical protein
LARHWCVDGSTVGLGEAFGMKRRRAPAGQPRSAFVGFRFPPEVILLSVRWYLRFGLSYRDQNRRHLALRVPSRRPLAAGHRVVFDSLTNQVGGDTNNHNDVFLRDRKMGTTGRASISLTEGQGNADISRSTIGYAPAQVRRGGPDV